MFRSQLLGVYILFIIGLADMSLQAQQPTYPLIDNIPPEEYNAHAQNLDICQSIDGIMYFANVKGVLSFDGHNWQCFPVGINRTAYSVAADSSGNIYVGGRGDIGMIVPDSRGAMHYVSLADRLPGELRDFNEVWNTICIGGRTYFNALKYLFVYNDGRLSIIKPRDEFHLAFAVHGQLWIHEKSSGMYRISGDKCIPLSGTDFFIGKSIFAVLPAPGSSVLIITRDYGAWYYNPSEKEHLRPAFTRALSMFCSEHLLYGATALRDGRMAFNTLTNGLVITDAMGNIRRHLSRDEGLQNETVLKLFQDEGGALWCALDNGISHISLNNPVSFAPEGQGFTGAVQSIAAVDNGRWSRLYIATTQGAFRSDYSPYDLGSGTDIDVGFKMIPGSEGQCWDLLPVEDGVLIAGEYVYYYNPSLNSCSKIARLQSRTLFKVRQIAGNVVLAAGREGLVILQQSASGWVEKHRIGKLPDEVISIGQEDVAQADSLPYVFWLGTWSKGVVSVRLDDGFEESLIEVYDSTSGLPPGPVKVAEMGGRPVFYSGKSVYSFDNETQKFSKRTDKKARLLTSPGASLVDVSITEGHELWTTSGQSVYHISDVRDKEIKIDSLTFLHAVLGQVTALYPDASGRCWVGGDKGLAAIDMNKSAAITMNYSCRITSVSVGADSVIFHGAFNINGRPVSVQPPQMIPELEYSYNNVTFDFASQFYAYKDYTRYSYWLEGYSDGFSPWRTNQRADFNNLPPGEYVFHLKARNLYHTVSREASYAFGIKTPWYRSWWAYLLYVICLGLILIGVIRLYAHRLIKEKAHLEQVVQDRTAEIAERNIELQSLNEAISEQKEQLEEKNKDITDSIRYAGKIQKAMLVSDQAMSDMLGSYFVLYKPKDVLSGDFYWAFRDVDQTLMLACVDCTGHGVPGAMLSVIGNTFLTELVLKTGMRDPSEILEEMRRMVIDTLGGQYGETANDGMDMSLCAINLKNKNLRFAAAVNPAYIVRNGILHVLDGVRQPVGYSRKPKPFVNRVFKLKSGDMLYLFSDGYPDQFGGPTGEKKFMYQRFKETLIQISHLPCAEQNEELQRVLRDWQGDTRQIDDITIIGLRIP